MIASIALRLVSWLVLAFLALPLVIIIGASLTTTQFLTFPPQGLTLHWYEVAASDPSYL